MVHIMASYQVCTNCKGVGRMGDGTQCHRCIGSKVEPYDINAPPTAGAPSFKGDGINPPGVNMAPGFMKCARCNDDRRIRQWNTIYGGVIWVDCTLCVKPSNVVAPIWWKFITGNFQLQDEISYRNPNDEHIVNEQAI